MFFCCMLSVEGFSADFFFTIKPFLSIFRAENVQVEEAIGKIVSILSFMTQEYVKNTTFCKQTCVGRWSKKGLFRRMLYCCMLFWWVLLCCILSWRILFCCMLYWWIIFSAAGFSAECFCADCFSADCFCVDCFYAGFFFEAQSNKSIFVHV